MSLNNNSTHSSPHGQVYTQLTQPNTLKRLQIQRLKSQISRLEQALSGLHGQLSGLQAELEILDEYHGRAS